MYSQYSRVILKQVAGASVRSPPVKTETLKRSATMELQAVAGQLYIVNGQAQISSDTPGLLSQSAPTKAARGRERDFLFVHLTLSGQPDETSVMAQDLLDTISSRFYEVSGSVTAALRKAITECNQLLLRYNLAGSELSREGALTCAVMRANELYIAQVGESFALLGHNFGIERFPPSQPNSITPLGRTAGLDIRYFHNWLQAGDTLLLADPRLSHIPTDTFNPVLIDSAVEDGLEELEDIIGQDSARVILVEFTDEAPGFLPDANKPAVASPSGQRLTPPTKPPIRESESEVAAIDAERPATKLPSVDVETVETSARKATSKAALGLSSLTGWLADLLGKVHSPDESDEAPTNWAIPTIIAIAIPILIAVVVTGVYLQRGRVARFTELKNQATETLVLAREASTPSEAEGYYKDTLSILNQAEELRPGNTDLASMRQEAFNGLDGISGVTRIRSNLLHQFDLESRLTSLTIGDGQNGDIYVLDGLNNRVFLVRRGEEENSASESAEVILFGEQVVGNHIVGSIQDLMWRPSGNQVTRDGLASLDLKGALISFFPNFGDTRAVPLALSSDWSQPKAITSFNERLYILDPAAPAIWRYFAEGEGFTMTEGQQAIEFVEDADLENVVDLAIYSEDGSVILLYNDGRLRRYVNGRLLWNEEVLSASGLEQLMTAPVALKIVGQGLNSSIFVADPGTDRIVQFSLGGTFLAQYKATDFEGNELFGRASDFAVFENPLRIIVAADNELYIASQ